MMSYKNTKDSFGGLLSEVSSIDSSLFEKKSLKEAQKSQIEKKATQVNNNVGTQKPSMQTPTTSTQFSPQNRTTPTASGPGMSMQTSASRTVNSASAASMTTRASDQFDALIGDFSNSRQNRPMRAPVKVSGVANSTIMGTQSASNPGEDHAGRGHDELDDLFSTSHIRAPLSVDKSPGSSSHVLDGFGQSHAPHVSAAEADPFDIFQSPLKQEPTPMQTESDDLLGGFEGSLGVEDHRAPADPVNLTEPVIPEQNGQEDDLDIFAQTPVPFKEALSPVKQNGLSQASTERATYSPDRQAPESSHAKGEVEEHCEVQDSRKPESAGDTYQHVPASHPHGDVSSARRDRPTSARRKEAPSSQLSPAKDKPESTSRWQSKDEGSSSWQAAGSGGKDSAKEWLDKGQKWLFTAGKKVAAAAKEASSTIQSKLDDMEVFKSQSKGPRTWSPDDDDMIPEYYKEWAATIERLGPEEQARTLGQMTEDDRLVVQRIMDQSSVRRSSAKRVSPTASRPQQIGGSEKGGARRAAPPRPPQRTHSAEALSQPSPPSRAASGSMERPRRSASYNLGTAPSADENSDTRPSGSASGTPERPAPVQTPPKPPVHSSPSPQKARPPPPTQKQADLLGLFGGEAQTEEDFLGVPSPQPAPSSRADSAADLFDMDDESSSRAPQSSAAQGEEEVDILGMFASAAPAARAENVRPDERRASAPATVSKPAASGLDELFGAHKPGASMIDFGDEEVSEASTASAVKFTAAGDVDVEGEPEVRRQARARRLAEKQAQIQAALAEKQARDSAEANEKERKVELREEYKERMKAWQQGKDGNIRALLSSLDTVLWENSGWKKPAMTELLEPQRVKRAYMKANLVVHPDKVKQKGGTVEQIVIADIAFDALKGAWAKFEAAELR